MKILKITLIIALMITVGKLYAEAADNTTVNWLTMEEAQQKFNDAPRAIFVDVYTDWCGWCRRMESETFSHPKIAEMLNTYFYPVKLNAEQEEPIVFQGVTYENENVGQRRATHSFAIALLQGQMSYPSVAFFDDNMQLVTAIPGFRPPKNMEAVLTFFRDEVYKDSPNLQEFISSFEGQITD